jgi:hypothetical protein
MLPYLGVASVAALAQHLSDWSETRAGNLRMPAVLARLTTARMGMPLLHWERSISSVGSQATTTSHRQLPGA